MFGEGDFGNLEETFDSHVIEESLLKLFEILGSSLFVVILNAIDSHSDDKLLGVFIGVHHTYLVKKAVMDHLVDS